MATRPIFVPSRTLKHLVYEVWGDFQWHAGFSPGQKKKNVAALHAAAKKQGIWPVLEVSTKSDEELGIRLSAFHLKVRQENGRWISLEAAFQGSKVFQLGGPYTDLYDKVGGEIKKDARLRDSGSLKGFVFQGVFWEVEPKTAFYDWLYLHAVHSDRDLRKGIEKYNGFTDIEFNPKRSINCQARSCALYVVLLRKGILEDVLDDRTEFLRLLNCAPFYARTGERDGQKMLFDF